MPSLKHSARCDRYVTATFFALEYPATKFPRIGMRTSWAPETAGPPYCDQVVPTGLFRSKPIHELLHGLRILYCHPHRVSGVLVVPSDYASTYILQPILRVYQLNYLRLGSSRAHESGLHFLVVIRFFTMKVLAIDPGYGRCGVAVVEKSDNKETLLYSACIETSAKNDFTMRLSTVVDECERLLKKYTPDALALEKLYFNANQKTAMRVAEVRGALINTAVTHGVPVFEYTPGQVKSAAAGSGSADKRQIATMLHALIQIDKEIRHDDEYDAIAVGITHLARHRKIN